MTYKINYYISFKNILEVYIMKEEDFNAQLAALVRSNPQIEGAALVSSDGLMISSQLPSNFDEDRVAAMSAALLTLGERAVDELEKGVPEQVTVKGDKGYIILTSAGSEAVLVVLAKPEVKLGLIYLDIKNFSKKLKELMS